MGCHRTTNPKFLLLYAIFVNAVVSVSLAVSLSRQHVDSPGYDTWLPKDNSMGDVQYADDNEIHDNHQQDQDQDDFNDDARELRTLKKTVIDGLGFKKIPDVTKMNVSQDEYVRMYDVYLKRREQTQLSDSRHMHLEPKLRIFRLKAERAKHRMGATRLVFNISSDNNFNSLQHATLRLLATAAESNGPVRVQLYQVLKNKRRRLVEEKDVYLAAGAPKWCEFDVTSAVRSWIDRTKRNFGLELHCVECNERGHKLLADSCTTEHCLPVITALFSIEDNLNSINSNNNREKRSAEQMLYYKANRKTDCHQNNKRCCRHKMDFNLNELGLDFIIQPKIFDGGICKGRCPPRYNAAHNHAILQGLMWKKNKNLIPRVCCSPSKLEHLEILMVDEDDPQKLTVKKWDNMVVQECACS